MNEINTPIASEPEILLERIRSQFPDLHWKEYKMITEGWDHEVIILDDALVFRFPDDEEYASALPIEIEVLTKLKPLLAINIPSYTHVAPDYSFAGYPIIPGKTLDKALFDQLTEAKRNKIAAQLADALSGMHTAIANGYDFSKVPDSYLPGDQAEVKKQVDQYLVEVLSKHELEIVRAILHDIDTLLAKDTPVTFVHGDVYSRHLLWDAPANKLGLIDFSDMARSDPALDFAELYEYGAQFVQSVYDQYTGPKDDTFLDRAWIYQRWIGVYMMTDYFMYHKTSFEVAQETFDRVKNDQQL